MQLTGRSTGPPRGRGEPSGEHQQKQLRGGCDDRDDGGCDDPDD